MDLVGHAELEAWLSQTLGRTIEVATANKLSGGAIQENWGLVLEPGHRRVVLRKDSPATIVASRSRAEEYTLMAAAYRAGVRVPEPLGLCLDTAILGSPFALFAHCDGTGYGPKVVKDQSLGGDRRQLGEELGRQLARIHKLPVTGEIAGIIGPEPDDPALAMVAQLRNWLDDMDAKRPALEWSLRWAELHAPAPDKIVLTHQDFRTGNFLIDEDGLNAILDWEFAGWSDPASDIGWFTAECWRFSRPDLEGGGLCPRADFYRGYETESGSRIDQKRVRWWEVMAHLRWAVIAIQQGYRHRSGTERSLHLELTGRIADGLTWRLLKMTRPGQDGVAEVVA